MLYIHEIYGLNIEIHEDSESPAPQCQFFGGTAKKFSALIPPKPRSKSPPMRYLQGGPKSGTLLCTPSTSSDIGRFQTYFT